MVGVSKEYKYRTTLRPASSFTVPKGFARLENDGSRFGAAVYGKPLTRSQIEDFSLEPLDPNDPINIAKRVSAESDAIDAESEYGDRGFAVGSKMYTADPIRGGDAWRATLLDDSGRPTGHVEFDSYIDARDQAAAERAGATSQPVDSRSN